MCVYFSYPTIADKSSLILDKDIIIVSYPINKTITFSCITS